MESSMQELLLKLNFNGKVATSTNEEPNLTMTYLIEPTKKSKFRILGIASSRSLISLSLISLPLFSTE